MDLEQSCKFPFADPAWVRKTALATAALTLPFLGLLALGLFVFAATAAAGPRSVESPDPPECRPRPQRARVEFHGPLDLAPRAEVPRLEELRYIVYSPPRRNLRGARPALDRPRPRQPEAGPPCPAAPPPSPCWPS